MLFGLIYYFLVLSVMWGFLNVIFLLILNDVFINFKRFYSILSRQPRGILRVLKGSVYVLVSRPTHNYCKCGFVFTFSHSHVASFLPSRHLDIHPWFLDLTPG
jgi:hypothetical protein